MAETKTTLEKSNADTIKITLVKSTICAIPKHRKTVQALGLRKLNSSAVHQNNVAIKGMIKQVSHLVKVENI